jgi:hypothetical protein
MTVTQRAGSDGGAGDRPGVKSVVIGAVPDRGGRRQGRGAGDMPAWKPRELAATASTAAAGAGGKKQRT